MSEIERQEVDWLWYPYIPFGKITVLQGDPGEGKTTLMLTITALLTNGKPMPECDKNITPSTVIYQTAEDGLGDTIKPRLEQAGADCAKVVVIDETNEELSFLDTRIEQAIKATDAKMLILDPLQAYLGAHVDIGGKMNLRDIIIERFPDKFITYAEVFCGAAWVFFRKPRSKVEAINDMKNNLANLYWQVQENADALCERLRYSIDCEANFYRIRDALKNGEPMDDLTRAAWYYQLLRYSYGSKASSYNGRGHDIWRDASDCSHSLYDGLCRRAGTAGTQGCASSKSGKPE